MKSFVVLRNEYRWNFESTRFSRCTECISNWNRTRSSLRNNLSGTSKEIATSKFSTYTCPTRRRSTEGSLASTSRRRRRWRWSIKSNRRTLIISLRRQQSSIIQRWLWYWYRIRFESIIITILFLIIIRVLSWIEIIVHEDHDISGRTQYRELCVQSKLIPCSYFMAHIQDKEMVLRYHQFSTDDIRAIAKALCVWNNRSIWILSFEINCFWIF